LFQICINTLLLLNTKEDILKDNMHNELSVISNVIKGIVHPKMKILSEMTHPHVVPAPVRLSFIFETFLIKSESCLTPPGFSVIETCRPRKVFKDV